MVEGEARVERIDFSIASQAGARRLTFGKLSQVMGSPDYISPEQVKGKRGDQRSDIYVCARRHALRNVNRQDSLPWK